MGLAVSGATDILAMRLTLPRVGVWSADVLFNDEDPQSGQVTLAIADGALSFVGTVTREGEFEDTDRTRVVAGAGGMSKSAAPKQYTSPSVRIVLADLLATAGETLSATADSSVLGALLEAWTTEGGPIGLVLTALLAAAAPAASWRMLPDGTLWVGTETWPDSGLVVDDDYLVIDQRAEDGAWLVALDGIPALPGTTFEGNRVSNVVYDLGGGLIRGELGTHMRLWFSDPGEAPLGDRIAEAFGRAVRGSLPPGVDIRMRYWASVVSQDGDTIEVDPEIAGLSDMGNVPLVAQAGDSVSGVEGGRALVGWAGDRSQRYVHGYDSGAMPATRTLAVLQMLFLGGKGAPPAMTGAHQGAEAALVAGLLAAFTALAGAATGPLAALEAGFSAAVTAVTAFQAAAAGANNFLSTKVGILP